MTNDERQEPPVIPPAIEPLSDTAWARVERGVWSRLDADAAPAAAAVRGSPWRSWRPVWAPLAAAAVIALVIGVVHDSPERAPLGEPSRAVSGASPSTISFGDVHIELDPQTALGMSHETGQPIASLERGAAWFTVAPR
ncbi:MAG TPA: hypothetical protein VFP84_27995, partial [Kofleriaceae bacterium]|nr:hypothetical protein [Kofleriaceae bacterium]